MPTKRKVFETLSFEFRGETLEGQIVSAIESEVGPGVTQDFYFVEVPEGTWFEVQGPEGGYTGRKVKLTFED